MSGNSPPTQTLPTGPSSSVGQNPFTVLGQGEELTMEEEQGSSSVTAFSSGAAAPAKKKRTFAEAASQKEEQGSLPKRGESSSSSSSSGYRERADAILAATKDISWADISEQEAMQSIVQVVANLDIGSRKDADAGITMPTFHPVTLQALGLVGKTIVLGAKAARVQLNIQETAELPELENFTYRTCFQGTSEKIVEEIQKLNTPTNKRVHHAMMVVQRFLGACVKPPQAYMFNSLGKEGSCYALSVVCQAIATMRKIPASQMEESLKFPRVTRQVMMDAFSVAFKGATRLGESVFQICEYILSAMGRRYASDSSLLATLREHLRAASGAYTQLFERNVHTVEQLRSVATDRFDKSGNKIKKKEKVTCKSHPTISVQGVPLLSEERAYLVKYNAHMMKTTTVISHDSRAESLVLTDRTVLTKNVLKRLYALTKRFSEIIAIRRSAISFQVKESRRLRASEQGLSASATAKLMQEDYTTSEWSTAEQTVLARQADQPDQLKAVMLSRDICLRPSSKVEDVSEFSFIESSINAAWDESIPMFQFKSGD